MSCDLTQAAPDDAQVRVGIMGASLYTGNRGVSALAASLARLVWQSHPDASVSLMIGHRHAGPTELRIDDGVRVVHCVNYRLSPRAALRQQLWWILLMSLIYRVVPSHAARARIARTNPWVRSVAEADFVGDIRGGDSFSDIYGTTRFILGCLPVLSVIWIRGGIHLLPQTYGPFRSVLARRLARHILLRAQTIWCRDRVSLQEVPRLTSGRRRGSLCPDVAFALEAVRPASPAISPPIPAQDSATLVGINVNGLMYHGGYTRANMFGLKMDYPEFLNRLVAQLLSVGSNRVMLVPHEFAPDGSVGSDPAACRALINGVPAGLRSRLHLVTEEYDQNQIKGVIGMCDFFVGSRMHACIAALSQGIPTVAVAYSRKFAGVFDTIGAADWVIDGRTECLNEALRRFEELFIARDTNRAALRERVATAKRELDRAFEHMFRRR